MSSTYQNFGRFYHINAHSMQNEATAMSDQEKGTRRPDFVIGDRDGTSCKREFTDLIVDFLRSLNYSVDINDPYKGMELTDAYSDPKTNKNSVQIEVNRRLYMDEITRIKSFSTFSLSIIHMLTAFTKFLHFTLPSFGSHVYFDVVTLIVSQGGSNTLE